MFSSFFQRKKSAEFGKHTDIHPSGFVPTDQSWMEYKQLTNDQNAYVTVYGASKKEIEKQQEIEKRR